LKEVVPLLCLLSAVNFDVVVGEPQEL
jgi:hypothetical protein